MEDLENHIVDYAKDSECDYSYDDYMADEADRKHDSREDKNA